MCGHCSDCEEESSISESNNNYKRKNTSSNNKHKPKKGKTSTTKATTSKATTKTTTTTTTTTKKRRYRRTPLPLKTLKDCEEFVLTIIARYIEAPTCHQYRGYQNDKVTPFIDSLYLEDLEHAWAKDILNGNQEGEEEELENLDEMLMILGSQPSEDHINLSDQKQKYFKFPSRTKMNTRGFRLKAEGSITTQKINANSNPGKSIYIYCVFSLLNIDSV